MKLQRLLGVLKLLIGVLSLATITLPVQSESPSRALPDTRKKHHDRENAFYEARAFQNGKAIPLDIYERALEQWRKIPRAIHGSGSSKKKPSSPSGKTLSSSVASAVTSLNGVVWKPIGPSPIQEGTSFANGRVSSIAINPNNPNVIYQGSSGGGVWKTSNGGSTWTPLFDQQPSLGTGEPSAIAVDPTNTNTIYVGTSGRFVLNISKGILKSTDGGGSWIALGSGFPAGNTGNACTDATNPSCLFTGQSINVIIVDPSNSNVLYLGGTNGLFRSTDGGRNWTQGTNGGGDARSLVLDSTSPAANRILYAGISGSGVRQSTNGGQTWTQVLSAATPAVATALGGGGIGEVIVDLAPATSPAAAGGIQVLYTAMEGTGGAPDPSLFRSIDQGANWNQQTGTGMPMNSQGGYSFSMSVDPGSPGDGTNDIIYLGTVGAARSTNSGNNFAAVGPGIHVDSHSSWVFFRQPYPTPSIVLTGNDGGIWRSTDGGASWSGTGGTAPTINAGSLQTALFYNLDVRNDASASATVGSLQDNGTPQTTGSLMWNDSQGGDGWDIAFDAVTTNNAYNSSGFWPAPCTRVFRSNDSGATFPPTVPSANDITPWGTTTDQGCYLAPMNSDPSQTNVIYASGSQNIWQTQNGGTNWRMIGAIAGAAQLKVAKANSNNVVAASGTQVFVSTNALAATVGPPTGVTFTNITRDLPNRTVARVAFDPNDPTVIFAVLGGFGTAAQPQNVFRTTISGTTWTDISPPVNLPVNALVLDGAPAPTAIYVGTDLGVLRSVDDGASWTILDDLHLPNVPVTDLAINAQAGVLRAATFGRGAFELTQANGPVISINAQDGLQFGNGCAGTPKYLTVQVFNVGTQDLVVNSVQRLNGSTDFSVLPNPSTPVTISPNSEVDFTVRYMPTTTGTQQATIRISSNDPAAPFFDLTTTGTRADPKVATIMANTGNFGDVCVGSFKDLALTIANNGTCDLSVSNIVSSSGQFQMASVMSFPLLVHAGNSIQVPIRFQPSSLGAKSGTLTVSSNDPATPTKTVAVSGNAPPPVMKVTGSATFGDVCAGAVAEKTISVCNTGKCDLHVTSATLSCPDFTLINNPFPATISPDSCLNLVIRFTPTSPGPKSCNLVINGDDPSNSTVTIVVTANTPTASIDVPPDQAFPPTVIQSIGACNSKRKFPISNTGNCNLKITNIAIGGTNAGDYSITGLPSFPIILQPGHIAGDGDLSLVFAPTAMARARTATVAVTYESDPVAHTTTTVTRTLCGEGVNTGARVLVTAGGVPINTVEKIQLQRINANRNKNQLDTNDNVQNPPLQSVSATSSCLPFQFHREYGTVSNPIQLLPGSYQVTVSAIVDGKRKSKTVGFDVGTCSFNQNIGVGF
jgi:Abnormal spindle-like microcephaly-assoc'd, ASPM-SPD-2-Hydin